MSQDLTQKRKQLTKLGQPVYYGPTQGVVLRALEGDVYRCSFSSGGVNWVDEVTIDKIRTEK